MNSGSSELAETKNQKFILISSYQTMAAYLIDSWRNQIIIMSIVLLLKGNKIIMVHVLFCTYLKH